MTRRRSKYDESCWTKRTSLEYALIGVLLTAALFSIALAIFLTLPDPAPTTCSTPQCIIEASQISEHVDFTVDPCDNFYKFTCGNFLKAAHGDDSLGPFPSVQENVERQLLELYSEPPGDDEHHAVATAKILFRACMDEQAIERDELRTINKLLQALGGWPVVEGSNWDATKFNWVQASYKLRELGYPFSVFLDLLVTADPTDNNRHIFEVSIPVDDFITSEIDTKEYMVDIATLFGANENEALVEMEKTRQFIIKLGQKVHESMHNEQMPYISTVYDYQAKSGYYVNWLQFINTIAEPADEASDDDFVIFPQPNVLKEWFYLISTTSKREQANYMMWKIIQATMPYLPESVKKRKIKPMLMPSIMEREETRAKFCLRETQKRFSPSPINIMYARKYLDNDKKKKVESMVHNIKQEFLNFLRTASWMEGGDKQNVLQKIQEMVVVVGAPDGYLDDRIFNEFDSQRMEVQEGSFLDLISRANKNHQTSQYRSVFKLREETKLHKWYLGSLWDYKLYDADDNVLRIPVTLLQGVFFNEDRPNYLNYGGIGTGMGHEFLNLLTSTGISSNTENKPTIRWSNKTAEAYLGKIECIATNMKEFELQGNTLLWGIALREAVALKSSYDAYNNWAIDNEELPLSATKYTPKQLFWIAAAFTTCQPKNLHDSIFSSSDESDYFAFALTGGIRHSSDFSQDFKCPVGSPMNPADKCQLF